MFSKALFKQSCKANGLMWAIVTFAVCFMLACLMIISGSGSLSDMKNSIEDSIIVDTIESEITSKTLGYYTYVNEYMDYFDEKFVENSLAKANENQNKNELITYKNELKTWINKMPEDLNNHLTVGMWLMQMPKADTQTKQVYLKLTLEWALNKPINLGNDDEYNKAISEWEENMPGVTKALLFELALNKEEMKVIYTNSINEMTNEIKSNNSTDAENILKLVLFTMNPEGMASEEYEKIEAGSALEPYDVQTLLLNIPNEVFLAYDENLKTNSHIEYILSSRRSYLDSRSVHALPMIIASQMSSEEMQNKFIEDLKDYNVDEEKYASFGLTYSHIKENAKADILTYSARLNEKMSAYDLKNYNSVLEFYNDIKDEAYKLNIELSSNLLTNLPDEVANALEEIGKMDLYSLMIGSIFFKIAGLLLPIIYMIMVSNNLISSQVESGSMAYILTTSTKRQTVTFTQACYSVISLFLMFTLTCITSIICFMLVKVETELSAVKLILINLDAFMVLFALSGFNFLTSCFFDKSKKSMALGGGISMFFLVATMLGLFGSKVIPSVVRIDALNNFNYVSLISLFDAVSIISGTYAYIWKMVVLFVIGIICYIIASIKFKKKDLPL